MKYRAFILCLVLCATSLHALNREQLEQVADYLDNHSGKIAVGFGIACAVSLGTNITLKLIVKKMRNIKRYAKNTKQRQKLKMWTNILFRMNKGVVVVTVGTGLLAMVFGVNKIYDDYEKGKKVDNSDSEVIKRQYIFDADHFYNRSGGVERTSCIKYGDSKILHIFEESRMVAFESSSINKKRLELTIKKFEGHGDRWLLHKHIFYVPCNKTSGVIKNESLFVGDCLSKQIILGLKAKNGKVDDISWDDVFQNSLSAYKAEKNAFKDCIIEDKGLDIQSYSEKLYIPTMNRL